MGSYSMFQCLSFYRKELSEILICEVFILISDPSSTFNRGMKNELGCQTTFKPFKVMTLDFVKKCKVENFSFLNDMYIFHSFLFFIHVKF